MRNAHVQKKTKKQTILYRVTFHTFYAKFVVSVLFAFFFIQPAIQAYAADTAAANEADQSTQSQVQSIDSPEENTDITTTQVDTVVHNSVQQDTPSEDSQTSQNSNEQDIHSNTTVEQTSSTNTNESTDDAVSSERITDTSPTVSEYSNEDDGTNNGASVDDTVHTDPTQTSTSTGTSTVADMSANTGNVSVDDASSTLDYATSSANHSSETASSTNQTNASSTSVLASPDDDTNATSNTSGQTNKEADINQQQTADYGEENTAIQIHSSDATGTVSTVASTTGATTSSTTATGSGSVTHVSTDMSAFQFSTDECVNVGNGSYYCNKLSQKDTITDDRVVFAAPDKDGDSEIYLRKDGGVIQITHNNSEDEAPYYDSVSNTIVWQRLINDRYQIVQYDLADKTETVLTHTSSNNMQPSREGDSIVWQKWVNNNWEIMLYDGSQTKQITHNHVHDIAPDIKDGYVIWHTNDMSGSRKIAVYEIATGLTSFISDTDGGHVSNPRFVLVYDTTYDNGDSVTKGFNPETGTLVPLSAQPGQKPVDIPSSDQTGQTRALIQNKSTSRDEVLDAITGGSGVGSGSSTPPLPPNARTTPSVGSSTVQHASSSMNTVHASSSPNTIIDSNAHASTTASSTPNDLDMASSTPNAPLQLEDNDLVVESFAPVSSTTASSTP